MTRAVVAPIRKHWWVSKDRLLSSEKVLGPFATNEGATAAREYLESLGEPTTYWIVCEDLTKCPRCQGDKDEPGRVLSSKLEHDGWASDVHCISAFHTKRREHRYVSY